jgi:long-subunit acyl-CoA synthetase (AMP-forming)
VQSTELMMRLQRFLWIALSHFIAVCGKLGKSFAVVLSSKRKMSYLAHIFYTSGSTGNPKRVAIRQENK